jgi:tetratricopeptide (TPR) repeat protein
LVVVNLNSEAHTENSREVAEVRKEFESRCPKPQWWDRITLSDVTISTYDDLLTYWQNKKRSKSQFFKAAYRAILDYPLDTDIVVNAIKLMHYTYSYPHRIDLQEYAIEKYFSYKNPYGKPGNSIASIVTNLGHLYNDVNQFDKTIRLTERLLRERENEINDHLLELLHLTYAKALHGQKHTTEAITVLKRAVRKYDGSWEKRLNGAIAQYEKSVTITSSRSSAPKEHVPKQEKPWWRNNFVIIGGLLLGVLMVGLLRGLGNRQLTASETYPPGSLGTDYEIEQLVMQGRKIEAIKRYSKIHNVGLNDAKYAIDQMARRLGKA